MDDDSSDILPIIMQDTEKRKQAATRRHHMDTKPLKHIFRHAREVASTAAYVSIKHDIRGRYALDKMIYHIVHDDDASSDITQTAIRLGCAAAKHVYEPEQSPEFTSDVLVIKAGKWALNRAGREYLAHTNVGSRKRPHRIQIRVHKKLGKMLEQYDIGELLITRETYTITYSKKVPGVRRREPFRSPASFREMLTTIPYLHDREEPLLAADMNAWGAMVGDSKGVTAKFDLAKCVNRVVAAKKSNTERSEWESMKEKARYAKRRGRRPTNDNVDAKRKRQRIEHGGDKLYKKLGHRLRNLKQRRKNELASITKRQSAETRKLAKTFVGVKSDLELRKREIKARYDTERLAVREKYARVERELRARRARCVTNAKPKKRIDNNTRQKRASKASRALDHAQHAAACCIVAYSLATGSAIVLENLDGMTRSWSKFNKGTRTRLHSAGMLKFQRYIYERARWCGVEVLWIHPRNTSALCSVCGTPLVGNYHYRTCRHCKMFRVDRDVNAVLNMLWTTIAARFGHEVRPTPEEVQRRLSEIVIHDPDRLILEGKYLRMDGAASRRGG